MNTTIGNKLREYRKQKGWSQEQVSDLLHISQSTYARMESGESYSWASYMDKICEVFEITPEELVREQNIVINNNNKVQGNFVNGTIINHLSEKLIEQLELVISTQQEQINLLQQQLRNSKNQ